MTLAKQRGQSLVEIALFLPVFLILITGIFELGYFFLSYIDVLDATREAARYGADLHPGITKLNKECNTTNDFYAVIACYGAYSLGKNLNPENGYDDVVVSAYIIINGTVSFRYEPWSLYGNQQSRFDNVAINESFGTGPCPQGIVIVEMWYRHKQILGLPLWTWAVPDPIPLYGYTIMPNATATLIAKEICQ